MNAPAKARNFTAALAVREHVPLLLGLMGPSGGGKTFSALRLATGIQQVAGGDIFMIDTEARRGLHYADAFKFRHVPFDAPFGSLDYLEALQFCVAQGAGVVIVDSMSHEHEGPGGLLDFHESELDRMAGDNFGRREAMKMLAWGKPKAARRKLINGLLQMNANFIFCFRAKNTVKPVKKGGKTEVEPQGFMPIAGDEFVFEMTMNALLMPGAGGVPTWQAEHVGERTMIKLPEQFRRLMKEPRPLDEPTGRDLALWARGGNGPTRPAPTADPNRDRPHDDGLPVRDDGPEGSGFPGDQRRVAPQSQSDGGPLSLAQRASLLEQRLRGAPNPTKVQAIWAANEGLRGDLDRSDPDRLAELESLHQQMLNQLQAGERI